MPKDFEEKLNAVHVPAFLSPWHDKDVNPDGELKKKHRHLIVMFENVKTFEQAKDLFESLGGVGCEVINSLRSYARYLCHLDNPEKAQYDINDVKCFSGADYLATISSAASEDAAIDEMCDYCLRNNVLSFFHLCEYARKNKPEWSRLLKHSAALYMREYLKSLAWTYEKRFALKEIKLYDEKTGELLV